MEYMASFGSINNGYVSVIWEEEALAAIDTSVAGKYEISGTVSPSVSSVCIDFSRLPAPKLIVTVVDIPENGIAMSGAGGYEGEYFYPYKDNELYFVAPAYFNRVNDVFIEYSEVGMDGITTDAAILTVPFYYFYFPDLAPNQAAIIQLSDFEYMYGVLNVAPYYFRLRFEQYNSDRSYTKELLYPPPPPLTTLPGTSAPDTPEYVTPTPTPTPTVAPAPLKPITDDPNTGGRGGSEREPEKEQTSQTLSGS